MLQSTPLSVSRSVVIQKGLNCWWVLQVGAKAPIGVRFTGPEGPLFHDAPKALCVLSKRLSPTFHVPASPYRFYSRSKSYYCPRRAPALVETPSLRNCSRA